MKKKSVCIETAGVFGLKRLNAGSAALFRTVRAFGYLVLEDHMNTCVSEKIRAGDKDIVKETVELIRKLN